MNTFLQSSDINILTKPMVITMDDKTFSVQGTVGGTNVIHNLFTAWINLKGWTELRITATCVGTISGSLDDINIHYGFDGSHGKAHYSIPRTLGNNSYNGSNHSNIEYTAPIPPYIRFHNKNGPIQETKNIRIVLYGRKKIKEEELIIYDMPAYNFVPGGSSADIYSV
jgi:hypothetical protein